MTLAEAVAEFEKDHEIHPVLGNSAKAPNGEWYVTVVCGGIKEEGDRFPVYCTSEDEAAKWWLKAAREYAPQRSKIYWRERPMLDVRIMRDTHVEFMNLDYTFNAVYSRFYAEPLDGPW